MDGCCVIKSPIIESDRSGDPITIKALSREPSNTGWTVYTRVSIEPHMEDLDNNQFQSNQPHDIANDTELVLKTKQIIIMNNREWIEEQKRKLVQIDR